MTPSETVTDFIIRFNGAQILYHVFSVTFYFMNFLRNKSRFKFGTGNCMVTSRATSRTQALPSNTLFEISDFYYVQLFLSLQTVSCVGALFLQLVRSLPFFLFSQQSACRRPCFPNLLHFDLLSLLCSL